MSRPSPLSSPLAAPLLIRCAAPDEFPASAAFEQIDQALKADPKQAEEAVKSTGSIFSFQLKNKAGKSESWYISLKDKAEVGKGAAPSGKKADGMFDEAGPAIPTASM